MAGDTLNVDDGNFKKEVLDSDVPVAVDFTAPWCGPCRTIAPALDDLATKLKGKVKIAKINVDDNQNTAQQYRVMSLPTVILFKKGEVAGQVIGAHKDKITQMIEAAAS